MKKVFNLGILSAVLLLQSCEEKGVLIDFSEKKDIYDSTYVAPVEAAQLRNVLIEEFTGASCVNCPDGHETVASLIASNPDRIVAVAYHTFNGGGVFKPVHKLEGESAFDFRDTAATLISSNIYGGVNSIPTAGIDRIPLSGSLQIGRTQWPLQTSNRMTVATSANINLTSSYNSADNKVILKVKIAYTKNVTTKNLLTLGVIESGIVDAQEYPDHIDMNYVHNHIFRKCLTNYNGNSVLDSFETKEAGRVYEYNYSFTPAINWKLENCYIVAFLSNNDAATKEIIQAQEVKLK